MRSQVHDAQRLSLPKPLVLEDNSIGIIDFQGAMNGPITYDLVSLLRDCYVDNSREWVFKKSLISEPN